MNTLRRRRTFLPLVFVLLVILCPCISHASGIQEINHANWLQHEGILVGYPGGLGLEEPVTGAEVAAFLQRALGWPLSADIGSATQDPMEDHWAHKYLVAGAAQGIQFPSESNVSLDEPLTAAQILNITDQAGLSLTLWPASKVSRAEFLDALAQAISVTVVVVHTNDTHGRVLSDPANGVFGWEKIATLIERTRRGYPYTLVLDAGDAWHGTQVASFFQGASVVSAMSSAGVDIMCPGNHDFNYGYGRMMELEKEAAFDVVSANIRLGNGPGAQRLLASHVIREFDGLRVGVFGLSTPETPVGTHPRNVAGLSFTDPVIEARTLVSELRPEVDILIALTHLGYTADKELATEVTGIDLIVGGHSHTELEVAEKIGETFVTQSGEWGKMVGREGIVTWNGKVVDVISMAIRYDDSVPSSPRTGKLAATLWSRVSVWLADVVGYAPRALDGERQSVRTRETDLGNLVADSMRAATGADIALTNGGGIRASIDVGEVTAGHIETVLPFENTLCMLKLRGSQVLDILEHSLRLYPEENGGFLQVSGLRVTFDPDMPAGLRVVDVKVAGCALDRDATYTVATNDFLASGGDGFTWFVQGTDLVDTGVTLKELMLEHAMSLGVLEGGIGGRIWPVSELGTGH